MSRFFLPTMLVVFHVMAASVAFADSHDDEAILRAMIDELWVQVATKQLDPAGIKPSGCALASSSGGFWQFLSPEGFADMINQAPNTLSFAPATAYRYRVSSRVAEHSSAPAEVTITTPP